MTSTANGWPVVQRSACHDWTLTPGLPRLPLLAGPAGFVLAHYALWHHHQIEALGARILDDWGWAPERPIRGGSTISAHCSGTALDLNAQLHPFRVRDTYRDHQKRTIRTRLAGRYCGVIEWGGDWTRVPDDMHFQVSRGAREVGALADRLRDSPRGRRLIRLNGERAAR